MSRRLFRGVLLWAALYSYVDCANDATDAAWLAWAGQNQKDRELAKHYGRMISRLVP